MTKVERALSTFGKGFSCSQAVFSTFAEENGLDRETALKIAGGFGGGMGRMGEVCGALSGAFMVLSLKNSLGEQETPESKTRTYEIIRDAAARFKSRNEHIRCRDLLGIDISTPEGHEQARKLDLFTQCREYVQDAVEILEEMM